MVAIIAGITSTAAGISATARVADGYGIIGAGNKASQEHKAQHCSGARQYREGSDYHPATCHTTGFVGSPQLVCSASMHIGSTGPRSQLVRADRTVILVKHGIAIQSRDSRQTAVSQALTGSHEDM